MPIIKTTSREPRTTKAKKTCLTFSRPSRPKIFIASSSVALPLARKIKEKLESDEEPVADVILWEDAFPMGEVILNGLREQAADVDFAVVLFTSEDVVRDSQNTESHAPRDNCVFELGLFMGALGLEPRRALLLRTKDSSMLSDLGGMVFGDLPAADDDEDKQNQRVEDAVEKIKSSVKELGYCFNHPPCPEPRIIPTARLLDLEKPELRGGQLVDSDAVEVLINTTQPLELNHVLAKIVCENMSADVSYGYFFQAQIGSVKFFSTLVSSLAATSCKVRKPETMNSDQWRDLMGRNEASVLKVLETMRNQLRIYFLPRKPDLEFCVHNASHGTAAICYLRHTANSFVEWYKGESAKYVADKLKSKCAEERNVIFQGCTEWDLYAQENRNFLKQLKLRTLGKFPDGRLKERVTEICFADNT